MIKANAVRWGLGVMVAGLAALTGCSAQVTAPEENVGKTSQEMPADPFCSYIGWGSLSTYSSSDPVRQFEYGLRTRGCQVKKFKYAWEGNADQTFWYTSCPDNTSVAQHVAAFADVHPVYANSSYEHSCGITAAPGQILVDWDPCPGGCQ